MPFEQKYDVATREAATARVLERLFTNPDDQSVLRVVSDEFSVGQQSLRAWVAAATPEPAVRAKPAKKTRRPRFSPVVTTKIEPRAEFNEPNEAQVPSAVPVVPPVRDDASALEAEAAALRRGNDALKAAMRVLLAG